MGGAAPLQFAHSLRNQASDVLKVCLESGKWSQDAQELKESCASLSKGVMDFHRGRQ